MNPFLKQVAAFLYREYGDKLHRMTVVFPGRRSGVFFNAYLNDLVEKPLLGPEVITIPEFISRLSGIQISDQISLILALHRIYTREMGHEEDLDEFYFWGEILLNDFNDVDNYLIDADDLFRNMARLREIDSHFDYLSSEQRKAVELFWGKLARTGSSANRDRFLNIWDKLGLVYRKFREELLAEGKGYGGLVARTVAESLERGESLPLDSERYVFPGFNALNACEQHLFRWLQVAGRADFFWDYDVCFTDDSRHEAGLFLRENLRCFPMPEGFVPDAESAPLNRRVRVVSVSGQLGQSQVLSLPDFFPEKEVNGSFDEAALVLSDESLLIPVVSAAGCRAESINITMGYPLEDTPVFSLISLLAGLYKNHREIEGKDWFYHRPVLALLNHQLLTSPKSRSLSAMIRKQNKIYVCADEFRDDPLLQQVFRYQHNWSDAARWLMDILRVLAVQLSKLEERPVRLESEYLYQVYLAVQRLTDLLTGQAAVLSLVLFYRLLLRYLQTVTIPLEGEPLAGLQVMGLLETRTLDFRQVIFFSVNEGTLPKTSVSHSFIPYNLRRAFDLPAFEERDAMSAYYFYRLLHRAEEVVLVYDAAGDGLSSGERSRFIHQLQYDSNVVPEFLHFDFDFRATTPLPVTIKATPAHRQRLLETYSRQRLSPSALNTYLDCRLKFYFQYLIRLKEADEVQEDIDPRLFGNLFHHAAEFIYSDFMGKGPVSREALQALAANPNRIGKAIRAAFAMEYLKDSALKEVPLTGKNLLIAENLQNYLVQMLRNDMQFTPFSVLELEGCFEADFELKLNGRMHTVKMGGIIDRVDRTEEGIRIVDYKTGRNLSLRFKDFEAFYDRSKEHRPKEIFQILIYSEIYRRVKGVEELHPALYKIDDFFRGDFCPEVRQNGHITGYSCLAG
ncbi:MAG: PD-(D/E)XK nuclease family protein, partial [Mangrovibacterium sp.]